MRRLCAESSCCPCPGRSARYAASADHGSRTEARCESAGIATGPLTPSSRQRARGQPRACRQVQHHIREGHRVAVDLDLEKFFDRVHHDALLERLGRQVRDKQLLALIARYLRAGVLLGDVIQVSEMGTPQGGPLSPLLAKILLHDLDVELERRGHRFVRYADDLLVLVRSERAGVRVESSLTPTTWCSSDLPSEGPSFAGPTTPSTTCCVACAN